MMVATSRRAPRHVDADGRQRRADPGVTPALGTSPLGDGFQKRRLLSEAWATFCGEVGRTWYRGRAENRGFLSESPAKSNPVLVRLLQFRQGEQASRDPSD